MKELAREFLRARPQHAGSFWRKKSTSEFFITMKRCQHSFYTVQYVVSNGFKLLRILLE